MLFGDMIAKIRGAQTFSACKLLIKRPSQNDPPAMKLQDVLIHEYVDNSLQYMLVYLQEPSGTALQDS